MSQGKGDGRRPRQVDAATEAQNWARTFGHVAYIDSTPVKRPLSIAPVTADDYIMLANAEDR